jgi:NADH-quinone oxidoreductase subunit G
MRFLPRNHDGVNEEWISDKTRFVWDGLRRQRLDRPYIRENGKLRAASWPEALSAAAAAIRGASSVAGLVGDLAPTEAAFALKSLIEGQGGQVECRTDGAQLPAGNRSGYAGTATIEEIDTASHIMMIGTNPRDEAPVLNARIRKAWTRGAKIALIGEAVDLTYPYVHMGHDRATLAALADKKIDHMLDKPSVIIVGQGALQGPDGAAVLGHAMGFAERSRSSLLVLHTAAGRVGAMDVGAVSDTPLSQMLTSDVIFNLGADEGDIPAGPTVIYQGSHGDRGAHRADIILPAAAYTEENGLFVNTEGRPQLAFRAGFPPGEAKENWAILRALSAELGATQAWDSLAQLRQALVAEVPHLTQIDAVPENDWQPLQAATMEDGAFRNAIADFYLSNPIARASQLMAELSASAKARGEAKIAAE